MDKEKLQQYDTDFQKKIIERFADEIPDAEEPVENYKKKMAFLWVLNAPEQYENEDEMMEYFLKHPDATIEELDRYFDEITPDGLPPCASEWEDEE